MRSQSLRLLFSSTPGLVSRISFVHAAMSPNTRATPKVRPVTLFGATEADRALPLPSFFSNPNMRSYGERYPDIVPERLPLVTSRSERRCRQCTARSLISTFCTRSTLCCSAPCVTRRGPWIQGKCRYLFTFVREHSFFLTASIPYLLAPESSLCRDGYKVLFARYDTMDRAVILAVLFPQPCSLVSATGNQAKNGMNCMYKTTAKYVYSTH
jgi:hypothetical protein